MAIRFDRIELSDDGNHLYPYITGTDGYLAIQTTSGLTRIGARNSSYTHFFSDRANFYFQKNVSFDGTLTAYGGDENLSNWNQIYGNTFFDKGNTSYFVNPDSNSVMARIGIDTELFHNSDDDTHLSFDVNQVILTAGDGKSRFRVLQTEIEAGQDVGSNTQNYSTKLRLKGKNNYSDGTNWYGNYGQLLFSASSNMTGSARRYLFTNAYQNNQFAIVQSADVNTDPSVNDSASGVNSGDLVMTWNNSRDVTIHANTRSPIFYDSDDTTYYLDPDHSTESLKVKGTICINSSHSHGNLYLYYNHGSVANSGTLTGWVSEPGMTYNDAGIGANIHKSGPYYGRAIDDGYGVYINFKKSTGEMLFRNTQGNSGTAGGQGTTRMTIGVSGDITASSSFRAPIFYDSNDTNYYLNPASTSKTSINIIDGRLTIGQSTDAGGTYRLYSASGGQNYFGGHTVASSITMSGTLTVSGQYANVGNLNFEGIGNSPKDTGTGGGTGYGSNKLLGYDQLNGSGRASATLGVNDQGIAMEYEKIFTFKVSGNGWVNRVSNPYKIIQAPGADKMLIVDEFVVYIDYETQTGIGSSGIAYNADTTAYSIGFFDNETGQQNQSGANFVVGGTYHTLGIMPRDFVHNSTTDRGFYQDVPKTKSRLIPNRSLFFKTMRNCSSSGNAPGGAHYIKVKYRILDISEEFNNAGCNHIVDSSSYHGRYAHDADMQKQYGDDGSAIF